MGDITYSVGVLFYDDGGRVLLVRHTEKARLPTGAYGFPAGRVDSGETSEEAAVRELFEEAGLVTGIDSLTLIHERDSLIKMEKGEEKFNFKLYLCRECSGELRAGDKGKTVPEFVDLGRLDDLLLVADDVKDVSRKHYNCEERI